MRLKLLITLIIVLTGTFLYSLTQAEIKEFKKYGVSQWVIDQVLTATKGKIEETPIVRQIRTEKYDGPIIPEGYKGTEIQKASELFEKGKAHMKISELEQAKIIFSEVFTNYPKSSVADQAMYFWAHCVAHPKMKTQKHLVQFNFKTKGMFGWVNKSENFELETQWIDQPIDEIENAFLKVIQNYPESKLISEVYLSLGNLFYQMESEGNIEFQSSHQDDYLTVQVIKTYDENKEEWVTRYGEKKKAVFPITFDYLFEDRFSDNLTKARTYYMEIINKFPKTLHGIEAAKQIQKIDSILAKGWK